MRSTGAKTTTQAGRLQRVDSLRSGSKNHSMDAGNPSAWADSLRSGSRSTASKRCTAWDTDQRTSMSTMSTRPPLSEKVSFNGSWISVVQEEAGETAARLIKDDMLTWEDGSVTQLRIKSAGSFEMEVHGWTYSGEIRADGKIYWDDGDIWRLQEAPKRQLVRRSSSLPSLPSRSLGNQQASSSSGRNEQASFTRQHSTGSSNGQVRTHSARTQRGDSIDSADTRTQVPAPLRPSSAFGMSTASTCPGSGRSSGLCSSGRSTSVSPEAFRASSGGVVRAVSSRGRCASKDSDFSSSCCRRQLREPQMWHWRRRWPRNSVFLPSVLRSTTTDDAAITSVS